MNALFDLTGKKALITGATGSIGLTLAQALAEQGATITIAGRDQEKLQEAQKQIQSKENIKLIKCDFNRIDAVRDLFEKEHSADIFVNSIGVNIPKSMLEVSEKDYDQVLDVNMKLAFFQTQFFVQHKMKAQSSASIIHVSSQMGLVGGFDRTIYCASKHAMEGFCKAAALELAEHNIRINTICPTFIATKLTQSTMKDAKKMAQILGHIPMKRIGELSDLKGAVVYLASDASGLVTGTALKIDGGWTAH